MSNNIPDHELEAFLAATPPATAESMKAVQDEADTLSRDPEYLSELLKTRFVLDIVAAMRNRGMSQSQLAKAIGKSRQYVSTIFDEENATNFTIETMTMLASCLGLELDISLCEHNRKLTHANQSRFSSKAGKRKKRPTL